VAGGSGGPYTGPAAGSTAGSSSSGSGVETAFHKAAPIPGAARVRRMQNSATAVAARNSTLR
jgi:hypothetical protein